MLRTLKQQHRSLQIEALAQGDPHEEDFQGRTHLVVPVIMLMEGVVWPFAMPSKELVLASEIEKGTVHAWNGRPVVMDHPVADGKQVLANIPLVLDGYQIGTVFNAQLKEKKLHAEAWLDIERCESLNEDSRQLLSRMRKGEMVEVSVGTLITVEENPGTYDGEDYEVIWRDIVPEHLAMLPDGTIGACSNEMGCGAPRTARVARVHRMNSGSITIEERNMPAPEKPTKTLTQRVLEQFKKLRTAAVMETGQSSSELNGELWNLLYSEEPAFGGIWDIFPEDNLVVYGCFPNNEFHLYRRKYANSDGKISLVGVRKEVEPVTRYETMSGEEPDAPTTEQPIVASTKPCGCNGGVQVSATMKERASKLITSSRNKFAETDRAALEALPEAVMASLEAAETLKTPEEVLAETATAVNAAKVAAATTPAPPPAPITTPVALTAEQQEAKWLETAPQSIQDMIAAQKSTNAQEQAELIRVCTGAQSVYSADDLKKMSLVDLRKTADLLKVREKVAIASTDYSARGMASHRVGNASDEVVPPAPSLADRFAKKSTTAAK